MKRLQQPWEEKLHDFLREDRNLLLEHGKLIKKLRPFVSGDAMKDFRSVEKALNSNIGEVLLAAEESGELERRAEAVQDVRNQLLGSGMQEKRVNYAIDVIQNALEWDREHQNMATESRESVATEKNQVSNPNQVIMYYNLSARDKANGAKVLVRKFGGTATMILEEGNWRLRAVEQF